MSSRHVTMVCMGNICRSPMAEAVLRAKLRDAGRGDSVTVDSAGTGGWHVGHGADPRAIAALADRGYDLDHRARQFTRTDFERGALIVALDADNLRHVREMAPSRRGRRRRVPARGASTPARRPGPMCRTRTTGIGPTSSTRSTSSRPHATQWWDG